MKPISSRGFTKVAINMTPMIDVCFQLIIFFMLTLRLFSPEGDFGITMPIASQQSGLPPMPEATSVKIRLTAHPDGRLSGIQMGQRSLASFSQLHDQIREVSGLQFGPAGSGDAEVELDCDYNLKFRYVVDALNAVTGYIANDKETIIRMIEKIRFARPRKPGEGKREEGKEDEASETEAKSPPDGPQ